jgi:hypothetical protein
VFSHSAPPAGMSALEVLISFPILHIFQQISKTVKTKTMLDRLSTSFRCVNDVEDIVLLTETEVFVVYLHPF